MRTRHSPKGFTLVELLVVIIIIWVPFVELRVFVVLLIVCFPFFTVQILDGIKVP